MASPVIILAEKGRLILCWSILHRHIIQSAACVSERTGLWQSRVILGCLP